MDTEKSSVTGSGGFDRRTLLKRGAVVGGAAVWAAPVVQSLATPAWAAGSPLDDCGRFTGGGRVDDPAIAEVDGGQRLDDGTIGFELHCSPDVVPNNLTVSFFQDQLKTQEVTFHLDALITVLCTFPTDPTPPAAPVSRIEATGVGHTTGAVVDDSATIEFTFTDSGEPGVADTVDIVIVYAGGTFTTNGAQPIFGGNIQAHRSTGSKAC